MKKKTKMYIALGAFSPFLFLFIFMFVYPYVNYFDPGRAIHIFKTRHCAEGQIVNPLIACGEKILPLLIEEIQDRDMINRGYAILALGHIGEPLSLNFLKKIIYDETEDIYTRVGAFRAVVMISGEYAKEIARDFIDTDTGFLADFCNRFLNGSLPQGFIEKRSFIGALRDQND